MFRRRRPLAGLLTAALLGAALLGGCSEKSSAPTTTSVSAESTSPAPATGSTPASPDPTNGAAGGSENAAGNDITTSRDNATRQGTLAGSTAAGTAAEVTPPHTSPSTPRTPAAPAPAAPTAPQPGSMLPQTNLNSKYPPLGVPVMSPTTPVKPLIIVVTLTREQTVALHEKQIGEKTAQVGQSIPGGVGNLLVVMGGAWAGASEFTAAHPNACVRMWVELGPTGWGAYATYITGTECPATMQISGQLPGLAR